MGDWCQGKTSNGPVDDPAWRKDTPEGPKQHDTLTNGKKSHQAHSLTSCAACHLSWRCNLQWNLGKFYKWAGDRSLCKCLYKCLCSCFAFHNSWVSEWRCVLDNNKSNKFSNPRLLCLQLMVKDIHSNAQLVLRLSQEWFCEVLELMAAFEKLKNFRCLLSYKAISFSIQISLSLFLIERTAVRKASCQKLCWN